MALVFAGEVAKAKSAATSDGSGIGPSFQFYLVFLFQQQRVFSLSRLQVNCQLCLGSSGSELSAAVAVVLFGLALGDLNYSLFRSGVSAARLSPALSLAVFLLSFVLECSVSALSC